MTEQFTENQPLLSDDLLGVGFRLEDAMARIAREIVTLRECNLDLHERLLKLESARLTAKHGARRTQHSWSLQND